MVRKDKEIKGKIIDATVELIKKHGDTFNDHCPGYSGWCWCWDRTYQLPFSDKRQSNQPVYTLS